MSILVFELSSVLKRDGEAIHSNVILNERKEEPTP